MRVMALWCVPGLGLCLLLAAAPARAQFEDLIQEGNRLRIDHDRPVTLDLRRVTAKDAVETLADLAQVTLACAPQIAERKVTVIARERSAREVGEGVARAVQGRWRRQDRTFILEPADLLDVVMPGEVAVELQLAFPQPAGTSPFQAEREILGEVMGQVGPDLLAALATNEGLHFTQLPPRLQQQIGALLGLRVANGLRGLPRQLSLLSSPDGLTLNLRKRGNREYLMVRGDSWSIGVDLSNPSNQIRSDSSWRR